VVAAAAGERLEITPLADIEVGRWRRRVLGAEAAAAPTLLRVTPASGDVLIRAWTGIAMGVPLVRRLGARSTVRVLHALGRLHRQAEGEPFEQSAGIGRRRLLQLGAGVAVATGMVVLGRSPAFAERASAAAQRWVEANRDRLPTGYDDLVAYPPAYRKAIYAASSASRRSQWWSEQLVRFRDSHPDLGLLQRKTLAEAIALAAKATTFQAGQVPVEELDRLTAAMIEAYGKDQGRALVAALGPTAGPLVEVCECASKNSWCSYVCYYDNQGKCFHTEQGCGTLWSYSCDGCCI
jgi:hypothetical protein